MSDWADGLLTSGSIASGNPLAALAGDALGGMSSSSATSVNNGKFSGSPFDSSGWNVNFGAGTITSDNNPLGKYLPFVVVGAVLLLGVRYLKKKG